MADAITIDDLRARIRAPGVAAAFEFLHDAMSAAGMTCEPERHGYMSSLRIRRGNAWAFSVAPAANWLLFYIRNPELRRSRISAAFVKDLFPSARVRKDGEISVRLFDVEMAQKMIASISGEAGSRPTAAGSCCGA